MNNNLNSRMKRNNISFIISKLNRHVYNEDMKILVPDVILDVVTNYDYSNMLDKYTANGKRIKIFLNIFQQFLVDHFDARFKQNDIIYLCRLNHPNNI